MSTATPVETTGAPVAEAVATSAAARPVLSVIVPVRNAAGSLPAALVAITRWIEEAPMPVEVIVVDDGSDDGTRATAAAFERRIGGLRVLRHIDGRGRLEAVRTGERAASGTLVAFGRHEEIPRALAAFPTVLDAILDGADVAALPRAPRDRTTPMPERVERRLSRSCRIWLQRALRRAPEVRKPAFMLCRSTALRRMLTGLVPDDVLHEPDWGVLARRARCDFRIVATGPR
jgi:glycosyltransferase involved in cell wall biosynthesis